MPIGSAPRLTDALARHAAERPTAPAVVDGALVLTWAELATQVVDHAARLMARGVVVGDRVALCAPDGAAALIAALGAMHAGAIHAPIDHTLAPPEVVAAVAAIEATWIADAAGALTRTDRARIADPLAGESAFIRCSSGTTGLAKGVLLSHATIIARCAAANRGLGLVAGDRMLWMLPLAYHFAVSIGLYVQTGVTLVFGNALRASATAAIARAHAVTHAYTSPYHVRRLAALGAGDDLPPSLRFVVATTTALDAGAADAFRARHGVPVRQGLGIIEVGLPFVSPGGPGEPVGALGRPLPDYAVRILDQLGGPVRAGEAGELAIAGPGLIDAYLQPWRQRAEILDDGCFRTGDVARVEADGGVQLLGRAKDVINVGGVKVFPLEVEAVLDAHPKVAASRVRAGADARTGEHVHAEVELRPGNDPVAAPAELAAWCAQRLAPLKRPAQIVVAAKLAMTGSGKVVR